MSCTNASAFPQIQILPYLVIIFYFYNTRVVEEKCEVHFATQEKKDVDELRTKLPRSLVAQQQIGQCLLPEKRQDGWTAAVMGVVFQHRKAPHFTEIIDAWPVGTCDVLGSLLHIFKALVILAVIHYLQCVCRIKFTHTDPSQTVCALKHHRASLDGVLPLLYM